MSEFSLETIRHSAAHVMAAAVKQLYPDARFDIGPATENGFYYDFDMDHRLVNEDLKEIEKLMKKIIGRKLPFERFETSREEAEKLLAGQNYKLERLSDIPEGEAISFYRTGDFLDLCRGPHVEHTGNIGAVKLTGIAGSYFRGDEKNPMLQRVYGTAFASQEDLQNYLKQMEEAAKRDHRKLGTELDLFGFSDCVGPGLVLWHPKGALIRHTMETFWKEEHYKNGYELLYTPHIGQSNLWETSGHLNFYRDGMYAPMEIDEKDLRIDTYRSSGAGGQHINKTDSAIRILHIPTGIVVGCQTERSQLQNKETALKMLRSKLMEIKEREHLERIEDIQGNKTNIEWGAQIRSYVFMPYTLAKDTRTGYESGNIQAVMDGDIDGFINAYLKMNAK